MLDPLQGRAVTTALGAKFRAGFSILQVVTDATEQVAAGLRCPRHRRRRRRRCSPSSTLNAMFSRLGSFWSGERSDYAPLPSFSPNVVRSEMSSRARRVFRQRNFKLFAVLLVFALAGFLYTTGDIEESMPQLQVEQIDPLHPPLYEEYEAHELGLPQHSTSLPPPDGSGRRFLFPANHMWGIHIVYLLLFPIAHIIWQESGSTTYSKNIYFWRSLRTLPIRRA